MAFTLSKGALAADYMSVSKRVGHESYVTTLTYADYDSRDDNADDNSAPTAPTRTRLRRRLGAREVRW